MSNFETKLVTSVDRFGTEHHYIDVYHSDRFQFYKPVGAQISYRSLDGLPLKYSAWKLKATGVFTFEKKVISTFDLGVTGATFSGTGFFRLDVHHSAPANQVETDTVSIRRSGGGGGNPDDIALEARYVGIRLR